MHVAITVVVLSNLVAHVPGMADLLPCTFSFSVSTTVICAAAEPCRSHRVAGFAFVTGICGMPYHCRLADVLPGMASMRSALAGAAFCPQPTPATNAIHIDVCRL